MLLARRVDYALKDRHYFEKPSVTGAFGSKIYTITACRTKLSGDYYICPVYELSTLTGLFYESELSPALYAAADRAAPPTSARPPPPKRGRGRRT